MRRIMGLTAGRIPHACGGEPLAGLLGAGVLGRIPHACGGEPPSFSPTGARFSYSPRVWG